MEYPSRYQPNQHANPLSTPVRILVCPLDWGIGHASRMIPLVYRFLQEGFTVTIAASGRAFDLMTTTFPEAECLVLPSVSIRYSSGKNPALNLLVQVPGIVMGILKEHRWLKKYVRQHPVDVILSDNRYGLWHRRISSVLVTHQVFPFLPAGFRRLEFIVHPIFRYLIRQFDRCWIPDSANPRFNFSGRLSHRLPFPDRAVFMGPLSRFSIPADSTGAGFPDKRYDILVILSGPEPQRSILETLLTEQLKAVNARAALVRGLPAARYTAVPDTESGMDRFDHVPTDHLRELIRCANVIICRSGYSTIMDLAELNRSAILIPTPGQPEQEYLARYLQQRGYFHAEDQSGFSLPEALKAFRAAELRSPEVPKTNLVKYVEDLLLLKQDHEKNHQQSQ